LKYREQDPEKVAMYLQQISDIPPSKIAYIDETGIDICLHREYARSLRGQSIMGTVSGRKFKRCGIVAAKIESSIIEPLQYEGTMDSELFELWFETRLLPSLPKGITIVMDNAAFHRKSRLPFLASKFGHNIIFLPPYSPELNPIENFWSWLKRHLKKILPKYDSFDEALCLAFEV